MVHDGIIGGCTMMACLTQTTPHCLAFSEASVVDLGFAAPMPAITDGPMLAVDPGFAVDPTPASCDVDRIAVDCGDDVDPTTF